MKCPRCSTDMREARIEESLLQTCPSCEGTWYPGESLGTVTDHSLRELRESALKPTLDADKLEKIDLEKPIDCPVCACPMMRYKYTMSCDVVLDECFDHGVWLDDGELGSLMAFLEELYQGQKRGSTLSSGIIEKNLQYLEQLSRASSGDALSASVLETLHQVHQRSRE